MFIKFDSTIAISGLNGDEMLIASLFHSRSTKPRFKGGIEGWRMEGGVLEGSGSGSTHPHSANLETLNTRLHFTLSLSQGSIPLQLLQLFYFSTHSFHPYNRVDACLLGVILKRFMRTTRNFASAPGTCRIKSKALSLGTHTEQSLDSQEIDRDFKLNLPSNLYLTSKSSIIFLVILNWAFLGSFLV
ncbi:hypothetical protein KQX54_009003 [Cotesia glomerata]|uniref:Uncharacterized protein n=1 Tax=Cotesia glomerata TaxID=32391 RepID=A0AAV7IQJ7_COTGL|nr:hypothetical protein KQX54_009003 [Cotesia glomerata]